MCFIESWEVKRLILVWLLTKILTNKDLIWEKLGVIYPLLIILENNREYLSIKLTVLDLWKTQDPYPGFMPTYKQIICWKVI